jgi:hypothetical protein
VNFLTEPTITLVVSLLFPIITRFFSKKELSHQEVQRLSQSIAHMLEVLHQHRTTDDRDQTFVKYWLDVIMCKAFKDDQRPPKKDWITQTLFVGYLRRVINRSLARSDISLLYSLSKGSKKIWPMLGAVKLEEAFEKHRNCLTRQLYADHRLPRDLAKAIEFASENLFLKNGKMKHLPSKIQPSLHSCLQAKIVEGGAASLFEPFTPKDSERKPRDLLDSKMNRLTRSFNDWRQTTLDKAVSEAETSELSGFLKGSSYSDRRDLNVVAIPEPSKFRIITKGDGFVYTALQPLQGQMLSAWKESPASTMLAQDLTKRINDMSDSDELPYFVSADYESATDFLNKECTFLALKPLAGKSPHYTLAVDSFKSGRLTYPLSKEDKAKGKSPIVIENTQGQPMGHPLSFPILCSINLAVYWTTLTRYALRKWPEPHQVMRRHYFFLRRQWQVLVNGDDMLFKADKEMYSIFFEVSTAAGLRPSVGKNYLSENTAMINSQLFHRRADTPLKRVGYLNLKFLSGQSLKNGVSDASPCAIGRELNSMFKLSPWTRPILPGVMHRWGCEQFLYPGFRPNWFVPTKLGGYGVEPEGVNYKVTREQRKVAQAFIRKPELSLTQTTGAPKNTVMKMVEWIGVKFRLVPRLNHLALMKRLVDEDGSVNDLEDVLPEPDPSYQVLNHKVLGWLERSLVILRATNPWSFTSSLVQWSGKSISRREICKASRSYLTGKDQRIISQQRIEEYRDAVMYSTQPIPLPPLSVLKLRSYSPDFERVTKRFGVRNY